MNSLSLGEFTARFAAEVKRLAKAGNSPMTEADIDAYALDTAPSYFMDNRHDDTPEFLAATDVSYWEHDA
jgi:hypothetical protein